MSSLSFPHPLCCRVLSLSQPSRGIFLTSPPRMSATSASGPRSAGDERSSSYVGKIDESAGPETPVVRSVSMAAGLEAAAYSQRARVGGVRKRFIPLKVGLFLCSLSLLLFFGGLK